MEDNIYSKDIMVVRCPSALDATNMTLTEYAGMNQTSNEIVFSHNVTLLTECERKDIDGFSGEIGGHKKDHISLAATATFHSTNSIKEAFEWAAYHRAAGVDHLWIYVNRDWMALGENFPSKHDYITWVPWNFHMGAASRERRYRQFKFQENSMNDALWRAKRLGIDWIATIDLDEFIVVDDGISLNALPQYFQNKSGIGISKKSAIQMNSIPFGNNASDAEQGVKKELTLDYVYRRNISIDDYPMNRHKLFLNPKHAKGVNTHYLGGGPRRRILPAKASKLRLNHYRRPENGVFYLEGDNVRHDSKLKDTFYDVVLASTRASIRDHAGI